MIKFVEIYLLWIHRILAFTRRTKMIGQKITFTTDSRIYRETYNSTILDIKDNIMTIAMPYHKGAVVLPGVGTRLNVNIEALDILFSCEILDRNIMARHLKISTPDSIARNNGSRLKKPTRVIAVTSGKGGVGKTSFTINLGIALTKLNKKVLIFDADLGMANVDVLLNIRPEYDILDVITGDRKIQDIMIRISENLSFIPGASGIQQLAHLSDYEFNRIMSGFNEVEEDYDYMLIDTGAGLSKNVTNFLLSSDEVFLITTTEPHAIMDAYSIVKVMTDLNADKRLSLIVNRCESTGEAVSVSDKIRATGHRFLNVDIAYLGFILEDKNVSRSIKSQVPLLNYNPDAPASKCISRIAAACTGLAAVRNNESGIAAFFNRLKKLI